VRDVRKLRSVSMIMPLVLGGFAFAADIKDMLGRWIWQRYTIVYGLVLDALVLAAATALLVTFPARMYPRLTS
jgi:hypothetical protein